MNVLDRVSVFGRQATRGTPLMVSGSVQEKQSQWRRSGGCCHAPKGDGEPCRACSSSREWTIDVHLVDVLVECTAGQREGEDESGDATFSTDANDEDAPVVHETVHEVVPGVLDEEEERDL